MKIFKIILKYLIVIFLLAFSGIAQINKNDIIVAYINNFSKYIQWPDERKIDSFRISIFTNSNELKNAFKEFAKRRFIKNKPVALYFPNNSYVNEKSHIVLIMSEYLDLFEKIYNTVDEKPVLLVSENYDDKKIIMINFYNSQQKQILFEVNKANVLTQKLEIDPEILIHGGMEIDVANLYKKSQISLRTMQKDMEYMKDSIQLLQKQINNSIRLLNERMAEVQKQKEDLDSSNKKLIEQQKIINSHEAILKIQKDSMKIVNAYLVNQKKELENKFKEIQEVEKKLAENLQRVDKLNQEVKSKNIELDTQSEIILRQKQILFLLIAIGVLTLFLIATGYIAYKNNKHKSEILEKQKKEIEDKLIELKELNLKLERADHYKSIFLASMSHELRTPLNSIIGYTGILLMGMTGKLNDEQNKQLNKVKNNAKHLLSLINDILDISKIEAEKVELDLEEFEISSMIKEIIEIVYPRANEKNLELSSDIQEDFIIKTDKRRIKQVILNLVSNAVNYTESGSVKIKVSKLDNLNFRVGVRDTGIGISDEEKLKLFQPFQQIDSSLTKKNKGTGLGLYLSRKIMVLLKGDISVESEVGKGSEFYIVMPINYN